MPLKPSQILALLNAKRADFETFDRVALEALERYRKALREAAQESADDLMERLERYPSGDRGQNR